MINHSTYVRSRWYLQIALGSILLLLLYVSVSAQEMPPRPINVSVNMSQNLSFGDFYQYGSGGTVIVSSSGARSSTGSIVLLSQGTISTSRFDITANPGTLITIVNGSDVSLNGSGGGTMMLHIGASSPSSPMVTTQPRSSVNIVYVGGTITVGNSAASPPGNYSGTFQITFVQQ